MQLMDLGRERFPAVLEVAELVEALETRRQQHDVTRLGHLFCQPDRFSKRVNACTGTEATSGERAVYLDGAGAIHNRESCLRGHLVEQRAHVGAVALTSADPHDRSSAERTQCDNR